jgi:23S rRNA pseudouridine955/2504/2580 synthase/23S rRNA pseudouridine1911/1915/1917 synthase
MQRQMLFEVPATSEGSTVADFLAQRFPYHGHAGWCERLLSGEVTVNGRTSAPEVLLRAGDQLRYAGLDRPEPPVDFHVEVVFDDDDLLLVNKSGNLPCHPGGRYFNHTLWAWFKKERGLHDIELVNRIDRETSGLVLVAKTPAAAQNCRRQFARHIVQKSYQVLVEAEEFPAEVDAAGWMTAAESSVVRKKRRFIPSEISGAAPAGAEWAETRFRLLKQCHGIALIEAEPRTGRLHQIRATLLALGWPVVGDKLYGVDETLFLRFCTGTLTAEDRARLRMDRQALHAAGLQFHHPKFGKPLAVEAALPADMLHLSGLDRVFD